MMKQIIIQKKERRHKYAAFRLTTSEFIKIKDFARQNNISTSDLIRYSLKKIIPNF